MTKIFEQYWNIMQERAKSARQLSGMTLMWIPPVYKHFRNEQADELAKMGSVQSVFNLKI